MGNVSYRFFTMLFNMLLAYMLLVNFLGWSGGAINLTSIHNNTDWTNSYFGFQSLFGALEHWDYLVNLVPFFGVSTFADHLNTLVNVVLFGLPNLFDSLVNGNWGSGFAILNAFILFFTQPIELFVMSAICLGHLVNFIFAFVQCFMMCLTGAFNIPFENMPSPSEYNAVAPVGIDAYRAFGYMLM